MCLPLQLARPDNLKKRGKKTKPTSKFRNVSKELSSLNTLTAVNVSLHENNPLVAAWLLGGVQWTLLQEVVLCNSSGNGA